MRSLNIRVAACFHDWLENMTDAIQVMRMLTESKQQIIGDVPSNALLLYERPHSLPYGWAKAFSAKHAIQKNSVGPGIVLSIKHDETDVPSLSTIALCVDRSVDPW